MTHQNFHDTIDWYVSSSEISGIFSHITKPRPYYVKFEKTRSLSDIQRQHELPNKEDQCLQRERTPIPGFYRINYLYPVKFISKQSRRHCASVRVSCLKPVLVIT